MLALNGRSLTGAWIETKLQLYFATIEESRRSLTGAWIETKP